jgi:hypothetical protein
MKKHTVLLFTFLPIIAVAADSSSLNFKNIKIELPSLLLTDIAKPSPFFALGAIGAHFPEKSLPAVQMKEFVSHMPIISQIGDIDSKMVRVPDSSIDYKLSVKTPEMAFSK